MKRVLVLAGLVLLLAISASGQVIRGTPPSVTSIGGNRTFVGGVPASVTSISPPLPFGIAPTFRGGFTSPCASPGMLIPSALGCGNPVLSHGVPLRRGNFGRRFHGRFSNVVPLILPYAYPYAVYADYDTQGVQQLQQPVQIEVRIVNERRGEQGEEGVNESRRPADSPASATTSREPPQAPHEAPTAPPAQTAPPEREIVPTVLVFRDGHRREVRNYVIMGKVLYDLESTTARKIQLAELDLPATIKENDDRGVSFTMPRDSQ
jgi:hypothetical protein